MNYYNYCEKMKKNVMKMSRKLLGIKTFPFLNTFNMKLRNALEDAVGKSIDDFTNEDMKKHAGDFALWRTTDKLVDIYTKFVELKSFELRDLLDSENEDDGQEGV